MYQRIASRLKNKEVILLDGAIGTQLQSLSVPMDNTAWAAAALHSHPDTVRLMHRQYLAVGADILTTNTYSSARHNLEPIGLGGQTWELNYRAVNLAMEARERFASDREIAIAGSISSFGLVKGGESERALHRHANTRTEITEKQSRANLLEQAEILAQAGVDFLLLECTGSMTQRRWLFEECSKVDLPIWLGFRCRQEKNSNDLYIGYSSDFSFEEGIKEFAQSNIDGVAIFHSTISAADAGIDIVNKHWSGTLAVYPEADRSDYTLPQADPGVSSNVTPEEFCGIANSWVEKGVQVIGGCCGINLEYFAGLKENLPGQLPG